MTMKNAMVLVALAVAAGCSSSPTRHSDPGGVDMAHSGPGDMAGVGGQLDSMPVNGDSGIRFDDLATGGNTNCSTAAQLIYVIDDNGTLSSFTPNFGTFSQSTFTDIGTINCNAPMGYEPFSMSVDRNAVAWVEYVDEETGLGNNMLFQVSTTDASCTSTSFTGGQSGFEEFGMGFVADSNGGTTDTLYIAGSASVGSGATSTLGTLDLTSFQTAMVGKSGAIAGNPELTGTGTGQLWAFIPATDTGKKATAASVVQLSTVDGTTVANSTIALSTLTGQADSWAFAYYGGDFFVFLGTSNKSPSGGPTTVYHVTTAGIKESLATTTRHIVGAGVSTCAPTVPPPPPT